MTTGQPLKSPGDRLKYSNEFMENLDLQIDINDKNLKANRLYQQTGQLPPGAQMFDNRSTSEKLADFETLKRSIIADLSTISTPSFAANVINGIMNSPLNVDNKLIRFLAQNSKDFVNQLQRKYKFGVAGDANDVSIMVEFLEDAYNKTADTMQSIKNYYNSTTSTMYSSNSLLPQNNVELVKNQLIDAAKRIKFALLEEQIEVRDPITGILLRGGVFPQYISDNVIGLSNFFIRLSQLLPSNDVMSRILKDFVEENNQNLVRLPGFTKRAEILTVLDTLKNLPKPSTIQTLITQLIKYINKRDNDNIDSISEKILSLFADLTNQKTFDILVAFANTFEQRATAELAEQRLLDRIQYTRDINQESRDEREAKKAQRVYVVNPYNDPVLVAQGQIGLQGNSSVSSLTNGSSNGSNNSSIYSSVISDSSNGSNNSSIYSDIISDSSNSMPVGYNPSNSYYYPTASQIALGALAAGGAYAGYRYLSDSSSQRSIPSISSYESVLSQQSPYIPSSGYDLGNSQFSSDVPNYPPPPPPSISELLPPLSEPVDISDKFKARKNYINAAKGLPDPEYIKERVNRLSPSQLQEVAMYIIGNERLFSNNGKNKRDIDKLNVEMGKKNPSNLQLKTTLKILLSLLPNYNPEVNKNSIGVGGLGIKGSGIYKPLGDIEINNKKLEKGILTIRKKNKSNFMDLPSKHISKKMSDIIYQILGGGIPSNESINNLSDEEKIYFKKLISKSNLSDRLSVPTPSKDQRERDFHDFEVMKGEILSGNDSKELVKKFKLLIMKLSKMNLLPKNEVNELMEDLVNLGY